MKINQRLFDHYGIDTTKDLKIEKRCPRPFDTVLIDKKGSCYACECQSWLPQSIGNLQVKPLGEIIGSIVHTHLQDSITDNTYRYCNEKQCSYLRGGRLMDSDANEVRHLRLAIDDSCNLKCPSCRKSMIFHKEGSAFNLGIRLADRINDWLHHDAGPVQVHIGSDGDPFASHVYRHFMEQTPRRDNIKYSILTNGLMFRDFHTRVPHVITNLRELGVSIDGATKETYEKLRLGGRWDKINENLECISKLKEQHDFRFILHFVVQRDNYHEMDAIVDLGERFGADRVWLNQIEDWGTMDDFERQAVWNMDEYRQHLDKLVARVRQREDRFIECPTLISEAVRYRNRN
jgi:MoaA/NifB/PqqE/SkfB family radical SAM enzyme